MAPFLKVNKAVLVKILTYHEGKELVLKERQKDKQIQDISDVIINMAPENMGLHTARSDSDPQGRNRLEWGRGGGT